MNCRAGDRDRRGTPSARDPQLGVVNVLIGLESTAWSMPPDVCGRVHVLGSPPYPPLVGDSVLAGYMFACAEGLDQREILKTAAAFGTAAC